MNTEPKQRTQDLLSETSDKLARIAEKERTITAEVSAWAMRVNEAAALTLRIAALSPRMKDAEKKFEKALKRGNDATPHFDALTNLFREGRDDFAKLAELSQTLSTGADKIANGMAALFKV